MVAGTPEQSSRTPNVLEPIQLMVDPQTNQHYMVVDSKFTLIIFLVFQNAQLFCIQIRMEPVNCVQFSWCPAIWFSFRVRTDPQLQQNQHLKWLHYSKQRNQSWINHLLRASVL